VGELLKPNSYLVLYVPPSNRAFVFRVKSVQPFPQFCYGPLPIKSGETLTSYDGGTVTAPADGVIPARSYTGPKTFPLAGAFDETDMWYYPPEEADRLYHVIQLLTPGFLRVDVQIPTGVVQTRFQRGRVITGLDRDFGFTRGCLETFHVPKVHYGFRYGNDTNLALRTSVEFLYAEYVIETPRDEELIWNILQRKVPSYWYDFPMVSRDVTFESATLEAYGIEGFYVYGLHEKEKALADYKRQLGAVKI
jgi:hypothetical protein